MPSPPRQLCFSAATSLTLIFRKEYSLNELKQKPAPEGVDPSRLEAYRNEADFQVKRTSFAVFIFTFITCWFVVTRSIRRSVKAFSVRCSVAVVLVVFDMKSRERFAKNSRAPRRSRA